MKIILPITIVTIVFLILGSTLAYWRWQTQRNEEVNIALTFSGSSNDLYATINGNVTMSNANVTLLPTNNCLGTTALQKNVNITYKNATSQKAIVEASLDVTLFQLQSGRTLSDADLAHIHWAITTNSGSCSSDVVSSGDFQGITFTNAQISNMTNDPSYGNIYNLNSGNPMITINTPKNMQNEVTSSTYYVYVWIDEDYRYTNIGNQVTDPISDFQLQLTWHGKIYQKAQGPNEPELVDGLIPVKLSDSGDTVTTVAANDQTWYNYDQKKWANAVLVRNDGTHGNGTTREYYLTHVGETVAESDILAYFVWIPRYSYQVWAYNGSDPAGDPHEISIKFVDTDTIETATQIGEYYTHPAFWWNDDSDGVRDAGEELSGIWVGKFETSHNTLSSSTTNNNLGTDSGTICNKNGCNNYSELRVLPNVQSLRYNRISNYFYASRFMESSSNPFGLVAASVDSHMMKNSEWGVVAYLSHSKYGINAEVRINNQSTYTTGCGALNSNYDATTICNNAYGTVTTYPQSTTGNVTGVFDMSGGSPEFVMGHWGTTTAYGSSSGFSSTYPLPASKYYDNYSNSIFNGSSDTNFISCTLATCGGHALNETKSWHDDSNKFVHSSTYAWFLRSGYYTYGISGSAGVFYSIASNGSPSKSYSFRLVLIAENDGR